MTSFFGNETFCATNHCLSKESNESANCAMYKKVAEFDFRDIRNFQARGKYYQSRPRRD